MLIVENVDKIINKTRILDRVTFQAAAPGISVIAGPRGSGKAMLLKIICGLEKASSGAIMFNNTVLSTQGDKRTLCCFMPGEYQAYSDYGVADYINFVNKTGNSARDDLAESLGITGIRDDVVGRLSQSHRQLLKLYAALANDRSVILIEEPFSGLDPARIDGVLEIFAREKAAGRCILAALQDLGHAAKFTDTIVLAFEGRAIAQGTLSELAEEYEVYGGNLEEIFTKALVR